MVISNRVRGAVVAFANRVRGAVAISNRVRGAVVRTESGTLCYGALSMMYTLQYILMYILQYIVMYILQ